MQRAQAPPRAGAFTARDLHEAIMVGAVERVRPKMMTVVAIMAGLLPILWSTGTGSEVMQRIAVPMIGGMVSSTAADADRDPGDLRPGEGRGAWEIGFCGQARLRRAHLTEKRVDLLAQLLRLPRQIAGGGLDLVCRDTGGCGALGHAADIGGHLLGAGRGLLHIARDLLRRRALLLDGGRNASLRSH